ncbi:hypothetical protein HW932_20260 [Allochromatium humboldtianum]|jgi:uncharacterized membrane protein YphA (DoxX/SURF4 family)|uniref:Seryl-tRNA synthetase n=1 Tax=Allochromatium humboldtianum TaxID=504901 RepID=A0A850RHC2_9GAMM|nr:hypothetical protein [Allochromatium humboldtianum]NVZ11586.1 hypothetical protein [Allochromatium humboldtianum]
MELFLKITAAILFGMMLFFLWPVYKNWQENGPKAQKGDWAAAILPLGAVVAFVVLLVLAVR